MSSTTTKGVSELSVYKKVPIIRKPDDSVTYEDVDGAIRTITDLGEAALSSIPLSKPKPKDDIPVPKIITVDSYEKDLPPTYKLPKSFVRYRRPTQDEQYNTLEYVVDEEDDEWLANNTKFGGSVDKVSTVRLEEKESDDKGKDEVKADDPDTKKRSRDESTPKAHTLPLSMLEIMLDVLEKETAFDTIITLDQAENFILKKLPQLYQLYPLKARAGIVTLRHVLSDVYTYWVQKRSKLKRPLLRRFWPITSSEDTNPHLVFRPREKEKYKLRKKRQNDMDAYRKLQQLRQDFQHMRVLLDLVRRREELNRSLIQLQSEWFQQRLYDIVDTSGHPRPASLKKDDLEKLMQVNQYFDTQNTWKKNRKARRGSFGPYSQVPSQMGYPGSFGLSASSTMMAQSSQSLQLVVAGRNNGEPAPSSLHPLATRESFVASWERAVPHTASIVNAEQTVLSQYRNRPRVGRGGRICIDRLPVADSDVSIFTAGKGLRRYGQPKKRLLDLLPRPLDHEALDRCLEKLSLDALREEYDSTLPPVRGMNGVEDNGTETVIVRTEDWLDTDDQLWGEEQFALGPV